MFINSIETENYHASLPRNSDCDEINEFEHQPVAPSYQNCLREADSTKSPPEYF